MKKSDFTPLRWHDLERTENSLTQQIKNLETAQKEQEIILDYIEKLSDKAKSRLLEIKDHLVYLRQRVEGGKK